VYGSPPPVATVAGLFEKLCYENKDQLSAGIIVAGWDADSGGAVYNIPLGGGMFQQPWTIGGEYSLVLFLEVSQLDAGNYPRPLRPAGRSPSAASSTMNPAVLNHFSDSDARIRFRLYIRLRLLRCDIQRRVERDRNIAIREEKYVDPVGLAFVGS